MEVFFPGSCVPKGRPRATLNKKTGKIFAYTPKRTRKYATAARKVAKNAYEAAGEKPIPADRGVVMTVEFVRREHPHRRPDIFNMLAQIADVMQEVGYLDDCQVEEVHAYKRRGKTPITRLELVTGGQYVVPGKPHTKKGKTAGDDSGSKGNKKVT
jgi:Holliday junction resolvase RusA-like endonuclease